MVSHSNPSTGVTVTHCLGGTFGCVGANSESVERQARCEALLLQSYSNYALDPVHSDRYMCRESQCYVNDRPREIFQLFNST